MIWPFFRVGRIRGNQKYFSFGLVPQWFYGDMVGLGWVQILYPGTQLPLAAMGLEHIHNDYMFMEAQNEIRGQI